MPSYLDLIKKIPQSQCPYGHSIFEEELMKYSSKNALIVDCIQCAEDEGCSDTLAVMKFSNVIPKYEKHMPNFFIEKEISSFSLSDPICVRYLQQIIQLYNQPKTRKILRLPYYTNSSYIVFLTKAQEIANRPKLNLTRVQITLPQMFGADIETKKLCDHDREIEKVMSKHSMNVLHCIECKIKKYKKKEYGVVVDKYQIELQKKLKKLKSQLSLSYIIATDPKLEKTLLSMPDDSPVKHNLFIIYLHKINRVIDKYLPIRYNEARCPKQHNVGAELAFKTYYYQNNASYEEFQSYYVDHIDHEKKEKEQKNIDFIIKKTHPCIQCYFNKITNNAKKILLTASNIKNFRTVFTTYHLTAPLPPELQKNVNAFQKHEYNTLEALRQEELNNQMDPNKKECNPWTQREKAPNIKDLYLDKIFLFSPAETHGIHI
ncbi:hypothetical protein AB837_00433 [bacterium AB1]|nr:hypothetical protein AB837_00433 [bacterium AB1]